MLKTTKFLFVSGFYHNRTEMSHVPFIFFSWAIPVLYEVVFVGFVVPGAPEGSTGRFFCCFFFFFFTKGQNIFLILLNIFLGPGINSL